MDTDLIDIHTHILPEMDDGARDLKQALDMASIAVQDGIKSLVATPHVMRGSFNNDRAQILRKVQEFNLCLGVQRIKLKILPGAEYYLEPDLPEQLASGQLLTINETGRYLLVEFPSTFVSNESWIILQSIMSQGVTPLIAHPERNQYFLQNPGFVESMVSKGIYTQVTSASITGIHGKEVQECALNFIQRGLAHIVASDAHSPRTRAPLLSAAFAQVEQRWGKDLAMILFCGNPWRVTRGRPLIEVEPQAKTEPKRRRLWD